MDGAQKGTSGIFFGICKCKKHKGLNPAYISSKHPIQTLGFIIIQGGHELLLQPAVLHASLSAREGVMKPGESNMEKKQQSRIEMSPSGNCCR